MSSDSNVRGGAPATRRAGAGLKTAVLCLLVACVAVGAFAEGSAEQRFPGEGREFPYQGFTAVETGWGIDVNIEQSDAWHVALFADPELEDRIVVEKVGRTLQIGLRDFPFPFPIWRHGRAHVEIAMPVLEQVKASGGARVVVRMDVRDGDVRASLSGGSGISGTLRCRDLSIDGSGGSSARLEGSADTLTLHGSGGATCTMPDFSVREADIRLSGGSSARLSVDQSLSVRASGGSHVVYHGSPSIDRQSLNGGSWIRSEGD